MHRAHHKIVLASHASAGRPRRPRCRSRDSPITPGREAAIPLPTFWRLRAAMLAYPETCLPHPGIRPILSIFWIVPGLRETL